MIRLKAQSVSQSVATWLTPIPLKITVHSVFKHGLNLLVNERLIFISEASMPHGITLMKGSMSKLATVDLQTVVLYTHNSLHFRNMLTPIVIDLQDVPIETYNPQPLVPARATLIQRYHQIVHYPSMTGFDQTIYDTLHIPKLQSISPNNFDDVITWLLGRGRGLTPTGDDILLGLSIVLHTFNNPYRNAFDAALTCQLSPSATTAVSFEYLSHASEDMFSHSLLNFLSIMNDGDDAAFQRALLNLKHYGHTSGIDTLTGIAIGLAMLLF